MKKKQGEAWLAEVRSAVTEAGAKLAVIAPRIAGVEAKDGSRVPADHALAAAPSVLFDAVVVAPSAKGAKALATDTGAVDWVRDAFRHLKVIGHVAAAGPLLERAGVGADAGVVAVDAASGMKDLLEAARNHRVWARERG